MLDTLFRYDVDTGGPIASGGCGELWRARDRLHDEVVAVKTIRDELDDAPKAIRSFELEALAAARQGRRNKHILPVRDLGRVGDLHYLVMDWVEPSVSGRADISLLTGRCSLQRARRIVLQLCDAVACAHESGIVHSDIAPWNVLFDEADDNYLLADFGLLRIVERNLLSIPSRSVLMGGRAAFLPSYAHRDFAKVSRATDVYALAVTLWHLVEGDRVLAHDDEIPAVINVAVDQRDAPDQLRQVLVRFIAEHSPDDDVHELSEAIRRIPVR